MKMKQLYVLLAVFGVLLFAALIKKTLEVNQRTVMDRQDQVRVPLISGIAADFVGRVVIRKGDRAEGEIVLKKGSDGAWTIASRGDLRTKPDAVAKFLGDLLEIRGEVRGVSQTTFPDFRIADSEGLHVILQSAAGADMAHVVFGTRISRPGESFVRLSGSEKVLVADTAVPASLGVQDAASAPSDRGFADFLIFSKDIRGRITRLEFFEQGKTSFVLTKAPDPKTGVPGWRFDPVSRDKVDPAQVEGYLDYLTEVEGRDLDDAAKAKEFGLEPAEIGVKFDVEAPDGSPAKIYELQRGNRVKEKSWMIYMRAFPSGVVYHVPENAAQNMGRSRKSFLLKKK